MLPLHLALIADLWILCVGIVGMYLLLAPVFAQRAVPAFAVTMIEIKFRSTIISYARRKEYYDRQNSW